MTEKIVNLSVHKNNSEQRRLKQNKKTMVNAVKSMSGCSEGFYFIAWDKNGGYQDRLYDPRGIIGRSRLPSFVGGSAQRMINDCDKED